MHDHAAISCFTLTIILWKSYVLCENTITRNLLPFILLNNLHYLNSRETLALLLALMLIWLSALYFSGFPIPEPMLLLPTLQPAVDSQRLNSLVRGARSCGSLPGHAPHQGRNMPSMEALCPWQCELYLTDLSLTSPVCGQVCATMPRLPGCWAVGSTLELHLHLVFYRGN